MNTKHGVNIQVVLKWNYSKINRTLDNMLAGICFIYKLIYGQTIEGVK